MRTVQGWSFTRRLKIPGAEIDLSNFCSGDFSFALIFHLKELINDHDQDRAKDKRGSQGDAYAYQRNHHAVGLVPLIVDAVKYAVCVHVIFVAQILDIGQNLAVYAVLFAYGKGDFFSGFQFSRVIFL